MQKKNLYFEIIFYAVFFLFFFQLLTDFIASVYAFGLLGTSIPAEIVSLLFLLSPILLLFIRRTSRPAIFILGYLFLLSRCIEPMLDTHGKMLLSGFGVSCFLLLFPLLIFKSRQKDLPENAGDGLLLAILFGILLKTPLSGFDISNHGFYQIINCGLAFAAGLFLTKMKFPADEKPNQTEHKHSLLFPCLSITSVFTLIYFAFGNPQVIVRWTEASYILIVIIQLISVSGYVLASKFLARISTKVLTLLNLLFVAALVSTIYLNQAHFPDAAAAFPIYQSGNSILRKIVLILTLVLWPLVLLNFKRGLKSLTNSDFSLPKLATGFLLSSVFLLTMIFVNICTTVYSYIPVIGEFFRDKYWFVFLIIAVPLIATSRYSNRTESGNPVLIKKLFGASSITTVSIITILLWQNAQPLSPDIKDSVKILSYNIQQGYDANGQLNYAGQLEILRNANADIIGLQETDIARIAGGNADIVRYFANALDMYAYYGPKTVNGTFGLALLSKFPIHNSETFYMPGPGEQTATITGKIEFTGQTIQIFNTHLGNNGPMVQQQTILNEVCEDGHLILMGDFNFEPETEQYQITTQKLYDAYAQIDSADFIPHRIDYIFISPQIKLEAIEYIQSPASDHPAVLAAVNFLVEREHFGKQ